MAAATNKDVYECNKTRSSRPSVITLGSSEDQESSSVAKSTVRTFADHPRRCRFTQYV